jgi:hypothetical protein
MNASDYVAIHMKLNTEADAISIFVSRQQVAEKLGLGRYIDA